jgi:putative redox protein
MLEGTRSPHPIVVEWEGGKKFRGGIPGGPTTLMDGARESAPSPVDSLVVSLATCSAIDVVEILEKRRTPVTGLTVHVDFSRANTPPRRLTEVVMRFEVATRSEIQHVERAVELSIEKYCSVASSLAPDTSLTWSVVLAQPADSTATPA